MINAHIALIYMNNEREVFKAFLLKDESSRSERIFHGSQPSVLREASKNPNARSSGFEIIGDGGTVFVSAHMARVVSELSELVERLSKLDSFLNTRDDDDRAKMGVELDMLISQRIIMAQYMEVLRTRIKHDTGIQL